MAAKVGAAAGPTVPKSTGNVKGPPQVVEVAIKVSSLENIDVKGNSVTIKGFLQFAWNDVDPPAKVIQAAKGTKLDPEDPDVWRPKFMAKNAANAQMSPDCNTKDGARYGHIVLFRVEDPKTARMFMRVKMEGTFRQHMLLSNFPFDCHEICLNFHGNGRHRREWLVPKSKDSLPLGISLENQGQVAFNSAEWSLVPYQTPEGRQEPPQLKVEVGWSDPSDSTQGNVYPALRISMVVQRFPQFYIWNIILVVGALSLCTAACCALHPTDDTGDRFSIIFSVVLTVTAYKLVVSDSLPKVPYSTLMDVFFNLLFFWVFLFGIKDFVLAKFLPETPSEDVARIDNISSLVWALGLVLFLVAYVVWGVARSRRACSGDKGIQDPCLLEDVSNDPAFLPPQYRTGTGRLNEETMIRGSPPQAVVSHATITGDRRGFTIHSPRHRTPLLPLPSAVPQHGVFVDRDRSDNIDK